MKKKMEPRLNNSVKKLSKLTRKSESKQFREDAKKLQINTDKKPTMSVKKRQYRLIKHLQRNDTYLS